MGRLAALIGMAAGGADVLSLIWQVAVSRTLFAEQYPQLGEASESKPSEGEVTGEHWFSRTTWAYYLPQWASTYYYICSLSQEVDISRPNS